MGWRKVRMIVLERDQFVCSYCCDEATEADHVIPTCQGGLDDLNNLLAACRACNASKGGLTPQQWFKRDQFSPPPWWGRNIAV